MFIYVVCPGRITSKTDGDHHFIDARRLMDLYRIRPTECYVYGSAALAQFEIENSDKVSNLRYLHPRYHGDYNLPTE